MDPVSAVYLEKLSACSSFVIDELYAVLKEIEMHVRNQSSRLYDLEAENKRLQAELENKSTTRTDVLS